MKASALWTGERFQNIHPVLPGLKDPAVPMPSLKDFLCGGERRVPSGPLPSMSPLDLWAKKPQSGLRITWLGHSTLLIEMDGVRILTDPVWGPRASPSAIVGPKRFQAVPISLKEMPAVDVVIVSHDHYDHLDYPTIRALAKTRVAFVTSLGVGAHLEYWGVPPERIVELDWWESFTLPGTDVVLTAAPSQHFSGRGLKDRNSTLWSSFAMRSQRHAVFFSGDTGLTTQYCAIRERLGPFDAVMLEIGAFYPAWGDIHLGPDNAVKAHAMLGGALLPVHWGTFSLAMHAWDQPAERLLELASQSDAPLLMPMLGQPVEPAHAELASPWWRRVDSVPSGPAPDIETEIAIPKSMSWPLD
jgi:L-ascorbate metabolism protein UlaG (beta-lactamase superfamily)